MPQKNTAPVELYNISRKYIAEMNRVLQQVHYIASEALLGFDNTNFFDDLYKRTPHFQLRWLKYNTFNKSKELSEANKYGIGPHKDYLGFTLFMPGDSRGLQNKIGGKNG
eukprot:872262_1